MPLAIPEMRKWVTSAPSLALRSTTMSPDCVSSSVVMLATCGVSPTGVTVMVEVATPLCTATVLPSSEDSTSKLPAAVEFGEGVNRRPACAWA